MRNFLIKKPGFTLVEVLVAVSIFTVVAVLASNILIDVVKMQKKTEIQNAIYEDARVILQQLTNEIQAGTIDYEEYYNMNVIQAAGALNARFYGINYGVYASRFYDPGRSLVTSVALSNPKDLGIECSRFKSPPNDDQCEIFYTNSADLNTGQNPWQGDQTVASALCDSTSGCGSTPNVMDELYLIDSTGTKKTIIAKKVIDDTNPTQTDYAIGIVRMVGRDLDQNGLVDIFSCAPEFSCFNDSSNSGSAVFNAIKYPFVHVSGIDSTFIAAKNISVPQASDLSSPFISSASDSQFVPLSPLRANVKDLKFIISPIEDPYKAYAERSMQVHPTVTIVLTLNLSNKAVREYPGTFPEITIQTTVAAGVIGKIESYPAVNDVKQPGFDSWINGVLLGLGVN